VRRKIALSPKKLRTALRKRVKRPPPESLRKGREKAATLTRVALTRVALTRVALTRVALTRVALTRVALRKQMLNPMAVVIKTAPLRNLMRPAQPPIMTAMRRVP
jgi:hypothetical protein